MIKAVATAAMTAEYLLRNSDSPDFGTGVGVGVGDTAAAAVAGPTCCGAMFGGVSVGADSGLTVVGVGRGVGEPKSDFAYLMNSVLALRMKIVINTAAITPMRIFNPGLNRARKSMESLEPLGGVCSV